MHSKIRMGLEELDLLIDRELYDFAEDRLHKVKKLCIEYQEYAYLIEIINREFRINHIRYDKIGQSQWIIYEELKSYLEQLQEQFKFAEHGNRLLDIKRKKDLSEYAPEEIEYCKKLLASDFLQSDYEPRSLRARLSRNTVLTFLHDILGNEHASLKYRLDSVALFRANQAYARHHSFDFLGTLRNLVNKYLQENQFAEAKEVIAEAISFAKENEIHREQLVYFYYSELHIEYNIGNLKLIQNELGPKITEHLEQYDIVADRIGIITFLYLAITHVLLGDYKTGQLHLRRLEAAPSDLKEYFGEIFSLVELISHYESHDHILLNNLIATKKRQIRKQRDVSLFYLEMLKFMKRLIDQPFNSQQLAQEFMAQEEKFKREKVISIFEYFRLSEWLKALAKRRSWLEIMQMGHKKT